MAGTAHHFLPATYLAGFSSDATVPRRKRGLVQGDKLTGNCHTAAVEQLAFISDLYTLREPYQAGSNAIDDSWAPYEAQLAPCIKKLVAGTINAVDWAGVLVPFVAALFARGPDFDVRLDLSAVWPFRTQVEVLCRQHNVRSRDGNPKVAGANLGREVDRV